MPRFTFISGQICRFGFAVVACCFVMPPLGAQEKATQAEQAGKTETTASQEPSPADKKQVPGPIEHKGESAAHEKGHHDPHDLSHQNASPRIEAPVQWKTDLAVATLLVFLCLLLLLSKFAWHPVMEGLERRESAIAANIEEARRGAEKAAAQLRHYEAKLAAATEEAREIVGQARKDADAARERILAEAQQTAQRERQRAVEDITAAKNVALQEMTQKSVDLAVILAGRLVRRQLSRDDHAQLIREVLDQFPSQN